MHLRMAGNYTGSGLMICKVCSGDGHVICPKCSGQATITCPDCAVKKRLKEIIRGLYPTSKNENYQQGWEDALETLIEEIGKLP